MFEADSFIMFNDLTPEGRCLWASASIEDFLGYTQDEIVGMQGYQLTFMEDTPTIKTTHQEVLMNDLVASQMIVRLRHKDGSPVMILCVMSICYEFIANSVTVLDVGGKPYVHTRAHSAAMTRIVEPKKEEFARIRRHHDAFRANSTWDPDGLQPEPRVCMVLNRFSRAVGVLYASPSCELILHIDAEEIVGKPFLLFIRADDLASFVKEVDISKATNAITHMRFWFQSPNWPQEIPCEAMLIGTSDGVLLIMRRCQPFVRRRLIESSDVYDRRQPLSLSSSMESQDSESTSSSYESTTLPLHTSAFRTEQRNKGVSTGLPIGSIKHINELDQDDDLKPMMDLHPEDSSLAEEMAALSVREYIEHICEYHVEETEH